MSKYDIYTSLWYYNDLEAEEKEWRGVSVKVATPATLYWLKKGTVRLMDQADAEALRKKFGLE